MNNDVFGAVLTTQFWTKTTALTVRSLRALKQLPLRHVVLVTDEKEPDGRRLAEESATLMEQELRDAGMSCEVFEVNCFSTARRWYQPICRLFDLHKEIRGVLNFPGDLERDVTAEQISTLTKALRLANGRTIILFDSESKDVFKQSFDSLFLLPMLRVASPDLVPRIEALAHSKLRTELFMAGREPFSDLRANLGISWGTDPTVQLITNSITRQFEVQSVKIGTLADDSNTRSDPSGRSLQITRLGHQILNDAIISSKYGRGDKPAVTFDELEALSGGIHAEIQRCLRRNRLLAEESERPDLGPITARVRLATHVTGGSARGTEAKTSTLQRIADTVTEILDGSHAHNLSLLVLVQPSPSKCPSRQTRRLESDRWHEEAERLNAMGKYPLIEIIFDLEYAASEPATLPWKALQRRSFDIDDPADAMLYFDVNMIGWPKQHLRLIKSGFHRMLQATQIGADMVLGDYHPVAPIDAPERSKAAEAKCVIESVIRQMLVEAYPDLFTGWSLFEELERPRTEFHALSRRLYRHLGENGHAPYDYGLFMLLAARLCGLRIERVFLGDVPEISALAGSKIVDQITRAKFEIDMMRNFHVMLNPVNPKVKISGLEATFAPFKGYSLVFDNPDEVYAQRDGLLHVHCAGTGNPAFYKKLFESLSVINIERLRTRFSLCPLPPESAHCTCFDGHNPDNLDRVDLAHRGRIEQFIDALPDSMRGAVDTLPEFYTSALASEEWRIDFVFDEMTIWGGTAFVAKLKAADDQSQQRLTELEAARTALSTQGPGLGLRSGRFNPHVSIAYFADPALGELAKMQLPDWTARFTRHIGDTRLSFRTVSLHAFTDMATYFKLPGQRRG
jgi:hypothetical protein